jgi:SAM-dependent methyltransferase
VPTATSRQTRKPADHPHVGSDSEPPLDPGVAHWDELALRFDDEVFDSVGESTNKRTLLEIKRAAARRGTVADFGCGIGRHIALLSSLFDTVLGIEQSPACMAIARQRCAALGNVSLRVGGRTPPTMRGAFDVVLCANVAIHPAQARWQRVLASAADLLRSGGRLVLVVPAAESAKLVAGRAPSNERDLLKRREQSSRGVFDVGGVPTKHFAKSELRQALQQAGLRVMRIQPNEYHWSSYGLSVPRQSKLIRPWDWVAVATAPTSPAETVTSRGTVL